MIIDFHNDTILKVHLYNFDFYEGHKNLEVDYPKIIQGGIDVLFFAFCTSPVYTPVNAMQLLKKLKQTFDKKIIKDGSKIKIADTKKDILDNYNKGIISAVLSLEGAYCIDSVKDIEFIKSMGFKLVTLTHGESTLWAGSDKIEKGIDANKGKCFIEALNENDIIIDLAHTSKQSIVDACRYSKKPVVISHCGTKKMCDSKRALEDEYLLMVKQTGGVVGVSFFPEHLRFAPQKGLTEYNEMSEKVKKVLNEKNATEFDKFKPYLDACYYGAATPNNLPNENAIFETIKYMINLLGEDSVVLGSDFDGIPYCLNEFDNIAKMPKLVKLLKDKYESKTVDKILFQNILKLF